MDNIETQFNDAELRAMVIGAINGIADAQTGPIKSATKSADALLIAAAIMIEANPQFGGKTGLESAVTSTSIDLEVYLTAMRKFADKQGQGMLFALSDWGSPQ